MLCCRVRYWGVLCFWHTGIMEKRAVMVREIFEFERCNVMVAMFEQFPELLRLVLYDIR
jgi:hypothetical protein